jgi:hypothetical protein
MQNVVKAAAYHPFLALLNADSAPKECEGTIMLEICVWKVLGLNPS